MSGRIKVYSTAATKMKKLSAHLAIANIIAPKKRSGSMLLADCLNVESFESEATFASSLL